MKILPDSNYERIYTGSSIKASYLKTLLEDAGISPIIRDDQESARSSGFGMDYSNGVKMFVNKEYLVKAKHIVDKALDDNGDIIAISEEELEKQALGEKQHVLTTSKEDQNSKKIKRSPFNLLINAALIVYSLWRLSPLLEGGELSPLRIIISSGIILFCSWALISHFRN